MKQRLFFSFLIGLTITTRGQNLLDASAWTLGNDLITGFARNGTASENSRELGKNHIGEEVIIWKASPDGEYNASGGWNTNYFNIDASKTYRLSVWLKKTNSHEGNSSLGFNSYANGAHQSLTLDETTANSPYFWVGDLPKLDRWYLIVGYVHHSSYNSNVNLGRIYDGVTGEAVVTITDFKFSSAATNIRHRSYLYYDTNTEDRQYFYAPRIDQINGNEPTINELLRINENSELVFNYDVAGNRTQRFYCAEEGLCSPSIPVVEDSTNLLEDVLETEISEVSTEIKGNSEEVLHKIYPNPTEGVLSLALSDENLTPTGSVNIYNINGTLVKKEHISKPSGRLALDLSDLPSGVYFIHAHLSNGQAITERIIKK
ncbi:T9SS type A sorting domain-containing protein [Sungkyunkwania multivorans]|uniref:T9SS type A sorting domain-containing protein n=1 Tax=Sungkyunkwania multivorans TaxID=1173618 RepID=A0ABW3D521_9FLAO